MTPKRQEKFVRNIFKFTAPVLAIFFAQLAAGIEIRAAFLVALYALYAVLADYFSKVK